MGVSDVCAAQPANGERVRTVVAAAGSLTVVTAGQSCELTGRHSLDDRGRLLLRVPDDGALAAEVALAPRGVVGAVLKFTDIAPAAVRDRVRARVTLTGWLAPAGGETREPGIALRLDFAHAELETAAGTATVGLDELTLSSADPLAAYEADMLTHLVDGHSDVVALLTRLADPRLVQGVRRVLPVSLDRYGLTLRLEHTHTHHDVRLPFTAPPVRRRTSRRPYPGTARGRTGLLPAARLTEPAVTAPAPHEPEPAAATRDRVAAIIRAAPLAAALYTPPPRGDAVGQVPGRAGSSVREPVRRA